MDWEAISSISALVASIATLATLFYLAIQVRESNKVARSSSLLAVLDGFTSNDINQAFQYPELNEVSSRAHVNWDNLPTKDKSLFDTLLTQRLLHFQKIMLYHKNGLIDEDNYSAWLQHTVGQVITPGGRQWWRHAKNILSADIIETVERYIEAHPDTPTFMETYPYFFESE
jgi:hypothetical protein